MKKSILITVRIVVLIALLIGAVGLPTQRAAAAFEIPSGATITSARLTLHYWFEYFPAMPITVHRVNAPWQEMTVTWNSISGNYEAVPVTTFATGIDPNQLVTVDILPLVQGWQSGVPNYGLLLKTPLEDGAYNVFTSREGPYPPVLEICYDVSGSVTCVQEFAAADASVWQSGPDENYGAVNSLYVGKVNNITKYSVLQFNFQVTPPPPPPPPPGPGTGTPGYWKNHPEARPVNSLTIGGITYTQEQVLAGLDMSDTGDKSVTMFRALVAAKLNVANGTDPSCIAATIQAADAWMAQYGPVGSVVPAKGEAWEIGEPLAEMLDSYNNGMLCAPARD